MIAIRFMILCFVMLPLTDVIAQPPPNDDPCGAFPLEWDYGCIMDEFSNEYASTTSSNPPGAVSIPPPACGPDTMEDVWYTIIVPENGELHFITAPEVMTDGGMAVYRVISGSCTTEDLSLLELDCSETGVPPNNPMPALQLSDLQPGSTLYIRIWNNTGATGSFYMCAANTADPPGDCIYTLEMFDDAGDGWDGGFVSVCVDGVCTNYTVMSSYSIVQIGAYIGQLITISYTAGAGSEGEHAFSFYQDTLELFTATNPPTIGYVFDTVADCDIGTRIPEPGGTSAAMLLYPNPTEGVITVALGGSRSPVDIEIRDVQGRLVHHTRTSIDGDGRFDLDLTGKVAPGVYTVRISEHSSLQRLVIKGSR